jgi:hypothetical protein
MRYQPPFALFVKAAEGHCKYGPGQIGRSTLQLVDANGTGNKIAVVLPVASRENFAVREVGQIRQPTGSV